MMGEPSGKTVLVSMWSSAGAIGFEPLFQRLWEEHVLSEVERRVPGLAASEYVTKAEIAQFSDGSIVVRLNEEAKASFAFRYNGPSSTYDAVGRPTPQIIDDVSIVNFGEDDPIAGHEVIIRGRQGWWFAFDFRSQRKQIARHHATAGQFLYTARAALEAGMLHAFVPALFDAGNGRRDLNP